jgi:hypothetical protein
MLALCHSTRTNWTQVRCLHPWTLAGLLLLLRAAVLVVSTSVH